MIFTPEHCAMNAAGTKTNTRRVQKAGDYAGYYDRAHRRIAAVWHASGRIKYEVGKTYATQPGRGKKANGRIRLLAIREERLQDISKHDLECEGYPSYDPLTRRDGPLQGERARRRFLRVWDRIHTDSKNSWDMDPPVWVLTYEFEKGSEEA